MYYLLESIPTMGTQTEKIRASGKTQVQSRLHFGAREHAAAIKNHRDARARDHVVPSTVLILYTNA